MSRSRLLARKDQIEAELRAVNVALGTKNGSTGAGSMAVKARRKPELWARRVALIEELGDVNQRLSDRNRRIVSSRSYHEFDPIAAQRRPPRPVLSVEPAIAPRFARPEGPRVPQRLYTQTVRKFLKPDCYPKF